MRLLLILAFALLTAAVPPQADARPFERGVQVAQNNGKSLSQAIDQVRRQTGGRILSAETRVQGGREVHHIKVLDRNNTVRTFKIPGRSRNR